MDARIRGVETYMAEIGRRCNTNILETKAMNLSAWIDEVERPSEWTN